MWISSHSCQRRLQLTCPQAAGWHDRILHPFCGSATIPHKIINNPLDERKRAWASTAFEPESHAQAVEQSVLCINHAEIKHTLNKKPLVQELAPRCLFWRNQHTKKGILLQEHCHSLLHAGLVLAFHILLNANLQWKNIPTELFHPVPSFH